MAGSREAMKAVLLQMHLRSVRPQPEPPKAWVAGASCVIVSSLFPIECRFVNAYSTGWQSRDLRRGSGGRNGDDGSVALHVDDCIGSVDLE